MIAGYTTPYSFDFEGIRIVTVMSDSTTEGLDAKTGKRLFSIPLRNRLVTNCTMPIYHNGHLFLTTGYDYGAKLYKLTKNEAEGPSWAHPVVFVGKLYLRHAQYLYCYDVKGE